jgi:hypothetical protein
MINCPKCGHHQELSDECIKCGIIFDKFKTGEKLKSYSHPKDIRVLQKSTLIKLWLYPGITLFLVVLGKLLGFWDGVTEDEFSGLFLIFVMILWFGIGGLFNFVKGIIHYISTKEHSIAKYLAAGLLLNGVVLSIPSWAYIENYMYHQNLKRHNTALYQIRDMHLEIESSPDWDFPPESQGLEWLRSRIPRLFNDQGPLVDPWGRPYGYRLENGMPYIWSYGLDGLSGTDDDIDHKSRRRHVPYYHWWGAA